MRALALWMLALLATAQQDAKLLEAVKKAEAKLVESPDDPEANLFLGKYLAFGKGEWERAIPCLSKASDPFYKALADKEKAGSNALDVGDAWWTGSTEIEAHALLTGATATMKVEAKKEGRASGPSSPSGQSPGTRRRGWMFQAKTRTASGNVSRNSIKQVRRFFEPWRLQRIGP
jgi:hypothetical protein